MSELTFTLLRLGFLVLLWLLVLFSIRVLRRDLADPRPPHTRADELAAAPQPVGVLTAPSAEGAVVVGAHQAPAGPTATPPVGVTRTPALAQSATMRLVVTEGALRGTTLPLSTSAVLIGRAPSCTLVLDDDYSSSRHARIFPQNGAWYVEDLGSTNGTYLEGQRLEVPVPVQPGEEIRIGQTTMVLQG
jgi:hypothetical protein